MSQKINVGSDFFNTITPVSLSSSPNYKGVASSYVVAGNGVFRYVKNLLTESLVKDTKYTINPDLPQLEQYINFNEELPRIPLEAFYSMLAFYKKVYEQDKTEAQMNFYWNKDALNVIEDEGVQYDLDAILGLKDWGNGLISYVPVQYNTPAHTSADDDPIYHALRNQLQPIVETHSHNTMAAFKSGEDERNSQFDELQLVIGHIDRPKFDFYNWITIRGKQVDNLENDIIQQLVDLPETFDNLSLDELPDVPQSWMNNHNVEVVKQRVLSSDEKYYNKYINNRSTHLNHDDDFNIDDYTYDELFDESQKDNNALKSFTNSVPKEDTKSDKVPVEQEDFQVSTNSNLQKEKRSKTGLFKKIIKFFKKG